MKIAFLHSAHVTEPTRPEVHPPWRECPQPGLWSCWDEQSVECEVAEWLTAFVVLLKPSVIIESGTGYGRATLAIAEGLKRNGIGVLLSVDSDPEMSAKARTRLSVFGLGSHVGLIVGDGLHDGVFPSQNVDLFVCDSGLAGRGTEVRAMLPRLSQRGVIVVHDTSDTHQIVHSALEDLQREGLLTMVRLPTPRGLTIARPARAC